MDSNQNGEYKRPKRPRIGGNNPENGTADSRFEKVQYGREHTNENGEAPHYERPQRPYQQRQNSGYQRNNYGNSNYGNNNYGNNYGNSNRQDNYQPRPRYNREDGEQNGYQPRQPRQYNNYNNNNNYNGKNNYNGNAEGGYQPRQQRPYNNNRYNNNNNRYNNNNGNAEGGYQPRQQRPYNNNRNNNYSNNQGVYQPRNNNRQGGYQQRQQRPGKSFTPRPKRIFYDEPEIDPTAEIRLNKFIANAGICSRREADELIQKGEVKVNGNVVTELGTKITPKDVVEYNDKVVTGERKCYVLLNKPKDCVTTSDDPNGRLTVMDLVKNACEERIYPVGRLDRNTTGVLLLTNDGDLASKLTHPQYVKKKIYHVWTDHDIAEEDMQRIADGIELEDGPIHADAISYANDTDKNQAGIEIHSGRNRIVRRIFESLGYHVTKLDRVYFAGLTKKNLPRGRWRYLTQEEVNYLKMGSFE
ncbi:MAG: rRNA pseudouridine synthase [Bacteroides sp.]|nr:rRNA pseudouridine synthase [Bacteroides sp.]MCM1378898.1 rRNA pseudouridine synthase [Bacteroides sp.]MCM1445514.1 rRNA pseudouridine synthase [Prevotella sp.]